MNAIGLYKTHASLGAAIDFLTIRAIGAIGPRP
jgi:hypothetical protein